MPRQARTYKKTERFTDYHANNVKSNLETQVQFQIDNVSSPKRPRSQARGSKKPAATLTKHAEGDHEDHHSTSEDENMQDQEGEDDHAKAPDGQSADDEDHHHSSSASEDEPIQKKAKNTKKRTAVQETSKGSTSVAEKVSQSTSGRARGRSQKPKDVIAPAKQLASKKQRKGNDAAGTDNTNPNDSCNHCKKTGGDMENCAMAVYQLNGQCTHDFYNCDEPAKGTVRCNQPLHFACSEKSAAHNYQLDTSILERLYRDSAYDEGADASEFLRVCAKCMDATFHMTCIMNCVDKTKAKTRCCTCAEAIHFETTCSVNIGKGYVLTYTYR